MPSKRSPNLDAKINRLTHLIEKGFAAVAADIADIKDRMATKDDVREIITTDVPTLVRAMITELVPGIVALQLKPIREQLKEIED